MGQGGVRLLFAIAVGVLAAVFAGPAAASSASCSSRLLADWRDGRIDGTYPVSCYRRALASLPEDVRLYSTAESDITRALQARLTSISKRAVTASRNTGNSDWTEVLVLASAAAILVAAGSLAALSR